MKERSQAFAAILLVGAAVLFVAAAYVGSSRRDVPIVFSQPAMLRELWNAYKRSNLEPSTGRTLDKQQGNITTSEGESYTMLRAVWSDDRQTFDSSLDWTLKNLNRPSDSLLAWKYGQRPDGTYGILTDQGGGNTASDADTDTALALIFASKRWGDSAYLDRAKRMLNDIWSKEVATIQGKPYLTADNLETGSSSPTVIVNPSYFAPYAYRIFAKVDPSHDWNGLVDTSYGVLAKASAANLDKPSSAGLPPDWIAIDKSNGTIQPVTGTTSLTSNFGYDALRVPWRIGLDWAWNKEPQAHALLSSYSFLGRQWQNGHALAAGYAHDGTPLSGAESPAFYGGGIGYFLTADPAAAADIYQQKLLVLYSPDTQSWKTPLPYYEDNWAWFGIALYLNSLPNLYEPTR